MKQSNLKHPKALPVVLIGIGMLSSFPLVANASREPDNIVVYAVNQSDIKGHVEDVNGDPIIGATVKVKGQSAVAVTDLDGKFTINAPVGAVLVVSYIGYVDQEVTVKSGNNLAVVMQEDSKSLNEVVVVGFGTQKKINLTGSVGIATSKEIASRPVANAVQALQGVIPGLSITTSSGSLDKSMNINVRGTGTISDGSSGSPLILIDGMEGDLNTVNPDDIESISVLKDAASSSIYGSRAPFGVILVTTKSGREGATQISYTNNLRWSTPLALPKSMDSYTWGLFLNTALTNSGKPAKFSDETLQKMLDYQAGKLSVGLDPSPTNPSAWENSWTYGYANEDLYKNLYKNSSFAQEHNMSVNGGGKDIYYFASFNYLGQDGFLKIGDDGLKRYNYNIKINGKLTPWMKVNASTRWTHSNNWRPTSMTDGVYNYLGRGNWPNIPIYDANGFLRGEQLPALRDGGRHETTTDEMYYQTGLIIEPVNNWITKAELNYNLTNINLREVSINVAKEHDTAGNPILSDPTSFLLQAQTKDKYLNFNLYTEYSKSFDDINNFKIMVGYQMEQMDVNHWSARKYGLIDKNKPVFDLTNGLNGKGIAQTSDVAGYDQAWKTVGFFSRLNYDFKGRYLAEINVRYDGSSRFRKDSRWTWSPSFSLGWNIAQEGFWRKVQDNVSLLKLRFSYGQLSNQNTTAWYPTYRSMILAFNSGPWLQDGMRTNTSKVGNLISTTLTWEKVSSWNVGLDWGAFNNRLTGNFDVYTRYTKDMVGPANELPATLGIAVPKTNNCDLHTTGWELQVKWRDHLKNGFGYGLALSLSDQNTYIDSYPGNTTNSTAYYLKGHRINEIWGYETIGIARTNDEMISHLSTLPNGGQNAIGSQWAAGDIMYKDLNRDGKIDSGAGTLDDHGDMRVLGDDNPHYFFSFDVTADWKGFDFRAFFQGVLKHDFWPGGDATTNNEGAGGYFWGVRGNKNEWHMRGFKNYEDYFRAAPIGLKGHEIPANTDAYFPRPLLSYADGSKNQQVQTRYMQNAAYIRLKNLQLGYTLPKSFTQKVGIGNCRIYVSAENVFTITPLFDIFDPETCSGGVGGNAYPLSRTWSLGLNLTL